MSPRGDQVPVQVGERHVDVSIHSHVTLHVDDVPVGGIVRSPFVWDDLLDAPPPQPGSTPAKYCLPGPEEFAGAERIENAVLASVDGDGVLQLEHRLGVIERVMGGAIAAEREIMKRRTLDWPRPLAKFARGFTRGIATFPDRMRSRATKARQLLETREGRARFVQGLVDPHSLSGEQKGLTLFLGVVTVIAALLFIYLAVTLVAPSLARPWRSGVLLFVLGFIHSLGAPILWEPVLLSAVLSVGPITSILVGTAGKVTAAYLAAFLGDEVNERLEKRTARSPRWAKALAWSESFAQRFGVFAVALFVATPGLPDAFVIYAFATLRMPIRKFLLGVAAGSLALNVAIVYGLGRIVGIG